MRAIHSPLDRRRKSLAGQLPCGLTRASFLTPAAEQTPLSDCCWSLELGEVVETLHAEAQVSVRIALPTEDAFA